jgi:hypothetical protein
MSKWMPTGLGAEPGKMKILIGLLALAVPAYWYGNSTDTPVTPPSSSRPAAPRETLPVVQPPPINRPAVRASRTARGGTEDFRPSLKLPDDFDLSKVDPTLRTDLLAKVREASDGGNSRSLFEFYTPPPPPPAKVANIIPQPPKRDPFAEAASAPPVVAPKPPPAPIPLKYFGYEGTPRGGGRLRALFVDGEDHFVVGENDTIRNRYRIVRIGTTSAEVEDLVSKNTQTLRILDRLDP